MGLRSIKNIFALTHETDRVIDSWPGTVGVSVQGGKRGIKLYESDWMDKYIASAHPITPALWYGPLIAYAFYDAAVATTISWLPFLGVYFLGVLAWTLLEYVMHKYLFHLKIKNTPKMKRFLFLMHGYHHEFPQHETRLVAPPAMSWTFGGVLIGLIYLAFGGNAYWLSMAAGTMTGYIAYDMIHYSVHTFTPRTRFGKALREYHFIHHYKAPTKNFGISNPLWDVIFGTFVTSKSLESEKASS